MNSPARVTTAAEGLPRRRFTVAEVEAMVAAGVMKEHERVELIGGELVPMSPKGIRHELVKKALNRRWVQRIPDDVELIPETTFRLSEDTYVEPDFVIYPPSRSVSTSSSSYDAAQEPHKLPVTALCRGKGQPTYGRLATVTSWPDLFRPSTR
jgi:Uma2 family endonuclease